MVNDGIDASLNRKYIIFLYRSVRFSLFYFWSVSEVVIKTYLSVIKKKPYCYHFLTML